MRPAPWRRCKSGMEYGRPRHHPGDVAGCYAGIQEAMQKTGVGAFKVVELGFDGGQKARVAP